MIYCLIFSLFCQVKYVLFYSQKINIIEFLKWDWHTVITRYGATKPPLGALEMIIELRS